MTFWAALVLVLLDLVGGSWAVVLLAGTGAFEVAQTFFWLWYSQRREVQVGAETLIGRIVEVAEDCRPLGLIRIQGELWQARCEDGAARGDRVRVTARNGLTLEVVREPG